MPEAKCSETWHEPMRIGLLGAAFDTGNMGVSALAESTIKCILHQWPDAEVTLLDSGDILEKYQLRIGDKDLCIRKVPIRFCKNIFIGNHFVVLCWYAFLFKVFRFERFKHFCTRRNASLRSIIQMDMVADITGGDSFSDIYGMRRFIIGFLRKWLIFQFNKNLIMLPQTYGPFKRPLAKTMARYILNRALIVYSRDRTGMEYVRNLLNMRQENGKVKFAPDVAFVLDSRKPEKLNIEPSADMRAKSSTLVGLNVSGLLFNEGYNRKNMFGLRLDYRSLIECIIEMLLKDESVAVLLIPHVFPPAGCEIESDPVACLKIYEKLWKVYPSRIFLVKSEYDQSEIKYLIGLCDFFIGSRMHSCIAALSLYIPAVGIAYSGKFRGVFESLGLGNCVADARSFSKKEILEKIEYVFERKKQIQGHLKQNIPKMNEDILNIFHF